LSETIPEIFHTPLDDRALDQTFLAARTRNGWSDREVSEALLRRLYDMLKFGPTAANSCPARFVWVRSPEGKAKLAAHAGDNNKPKILAAPVTAIIGFDYDFGEQMPLLFPARGEAMRENYRKQTDEQKHTFVLRNSSLQGAYLIIAARALGLDTGPMSGFNNANVDEAFFAGTRIKSNFICTLGYGNEDKLFGRLPRLSFEQASSFA
jgi:nitroreductase